MISPFSLVLGESSKCIWAFLEWEWNGGSAQARAFEYAVRHRPAQARAFEYAVRHRPAHVRTKVHFTMVGNIKLGLRR
jgi:hypothetical protein